MVNHQVVTLDECRLKHKLSFIRWRLTSNWIMCGMYGIGVATQSNWPIYRIVVQIQRKQMKHHDDLTLICKRLILWIEQRKRMQQSVRKRNVTSSISNENSIENLFKFVDIFCAFKMTLVGQLISMKRINFEMQWIIIRWEINAFKLKIYSYLWFRFNKYDINHWL